jgi:type IV pilus assembly protein PilW
MKRVQQGFGLVEMMISLVIGLILLLGISAILISMTRTSNLRLRMAEVQGGQRMAMTMLANGVRYAGAFPYALTSTAATVFPASGSFGVGQSVIGTGDNNKTDTVSLRFVASASGTASQGCSAALVAGHNYTNVLSVTDGYLTCVETDTTAATAATTVKLIEGLEGMNILYGVDSAAGGFVTQYLKASEIAGGAWDNVKTVKVTLIFTNPLAKDKGQADKPTVSVTQTIPHAIGL